MGILRNPQLGAAVTRKKKSKSKRSAEFAKEVGLALRDAARDARKTARLHGTPICVWENGKIVEKKP
jgi:hypothetical protein